MKHQEICTIFWMDRVGTTGNFGRLYRNNATRECAKLNKDSQGVMTYWVEPLPTPTPQEEAEHAEYLDDVRTRASNYPI